MDETAIAAPEQTSQCAVFRYRGRGHLFAGAGLPEYDETHATMMTERAGVRVFAVTLRPREPSTLALGVENSASVTVG